MNGEYKVTDQQTEAALRVLRAAGIDTAGLAEAVVNAAYALQATFEAVVEIVRQLLPPVIDRLSEIIEEIEEAAFTPDPPAARRRKLNRERARLIESRYRAQIRHYERVTPYRRIFKPP